MELINYGLSMLCQGILIGLGLALMFHDVFLISVIGFICFFIGMDWRYRWNKNG